MTKEMELRSKEGRVFRDEVLKNSFIWESEIKDLYIPGTKYTTTNILAKAFNVDPQKIRDAVTNHRGEFATDGIKTKKINELMEYLGNSIINIESMQGKKILTFKNGQKMALGISTIKLFPRDAILRLAMILTDCNAAQIIRCMMVGEEVDFRELPETIQLTETDSINVRIENDELVTDSWNVATVFGKKHDRVLESIRVSIRNLNEKFERKRIQDDSQLSKESSCIEKYYRKVYAPAMNKADRVGYEMTFDGFILLAMSFNGAKAFDIKTDYIDTFNKMRKTLIKISEERVENTVVANVAEIEEMQKQFEDMKIRNKLLAHWQKDNMSRIKSLEDAVASEQDKAKVLKDHIALQREEIEMLKNGKSNIIDIDTIRENHTGELFNWSNPNRRDYVYNCIVRFSRKVNRSEETILKHIHNSLMLLYGDKIWKESLKKNDCVGVYKLVKPKHEKKFEKTFKQLCKDFGVSLEDVVLAA